MKRARKQQQKDQRRAHIVSEAWNRYQQAGSEAVTMAAIADGVGLAKGTLYLYFPTKESLLLEVLTVEFARWFEECERLLHAALASEESSSTTDRVANTLSQSLADRPHLVQLLAESHVILEQNADEAAIFRYKTMIAEGMERLAGPLSTVVDSPGTADAARHERATELLRLVYGLTIGLWSMTRRAPAVENVITRHPRLSTFRIEFAESLRNAIVLLFRGMINDPQRNKTRGTTRRER